MELNKAIEFIKEHDRFLLSTHINPDGDGIGSIMGLIGILKQLGKRYTVIFHDPPQEKLSFMERIEEVKVYDESMREKSDLFDAAIIIDVPHLERIGDVKELIPSGAPVLNIDHHVSNDRYGTCNLIDPGASASAQIIGAIFEGMGVEMDLASAQALYIGLSVDTGRFRFNNTTPEVFGFAEKLIRAGVQPDIVADKLYYDTKRETHAGLAKMLSSIEIHNGGKVATAYLDFDFLNSDMGKKMDTEGFVNYPLSITGVEVAFLIQEPVKNQVRVSLRSKTDFDVNKLAQLFGGGGHPRASGCRIKGTIQEAKTKLLEATNSRIQETG